jgi:hypothetical protein
MAYLVTLTSSYDWFGRETYVYPDIALGHAVVETFNGLAKRHGLMVEATGKEVPDDMVYPTGIELFENIVLSDQRMIA